MASKLRSLRRNIQKLEKQGFILPSFVKQITKESTAQKYSQKKLMEISKFKEMYKGKERIVSGERGRELILRERAQRSAETRRRKREEAESFGSDRVWSRPEEARMLDYRLKQYFTQFQNRTLGELFDDIYEEQKASAPSELAFLLTLLDIKNDVIERVQKALLLHYPQNTGEEITEAGNEWLQFLTDNAPSMEQRMALGDAEDL